MPGSYVPYEGAPSRPSISRGAGDQLLEAVAERIGHSLRRHGTLARFGGDEFVILC